MSQEEKQDVENLQEAYENLPPVVVPYAPVDPLESAIYALHAREQFLKDTQRGS